MANEPGAAAPQLSGNVLLYRQPEPLNRAQHEKLGVMREGDHLAFLKTAHFVPIVAGEFAQVAKHFPIIFAGDAHIPLAVMGLREGQNLFVSEDGKFERYVYIPSYIRRYPFVLAGSEQDGKTVVCIDRAYEAIQENADIPFFENGEPSQYTQNSIQFLQSYETHRAATQDMVDELKERDLFEDKISNYNPLNADGSKGQPIALAQYRGLSEEKVRALGADDLKDLMDKNYLPQIYAQIFSFGNWDHIVARASARGELPQPASTPAGDTPDGGESAVETSGS